MTDPRQEPDSIHKFKMNKILVLILLISLVSLACMSSKGDDLETSIANLLGLQSDDDTSDNSSSKILLKDNFNDAYSGWTISESEDGAAGYVNGTYFVKSNRSGNTVWGLAGENFSDVSIEVSAKQVSGPSNNNNDYGVICRMSGSGGYSFNISGDGFYSIQIIQNGIFSDLVRWTRSSKIKTGNATNKIKVVCNGSTLAFYVNGKKLAQATDSTFTSGDIAFATTTYEDEASEIRFDNLVVKLP